LLEVVGALDASGRLAHFLHGGQEQANEDGNDGDDHEQLDQRERIAFPDHGRVPRRLNPGWETPFDTGRPRNPLRGVSARMATNERTEWRSIRGVYPTG